MTVEAQPIRVLIADDHPILREGLRRLLEDDGGFEVVGQASDGLEAVDVVRRTRPGQSSRERLFLAATNSR